MDEKVQKEQIYRIASAYGDLYKIRSPEWDCRKHPILKLAVENSNAELCQPTALHEKNGDLLIQTVEHGVEKLFIEDARLYCRPNPERLISNSGYHGEKFTDANKTSVNAVFISLVQRFDSSKQHNVMYLDSEMGHTTYGLAAAGFPSAKLFLVNCDQKLSKAMSCILRESTTVCAEFAYEWIRDVCTQTKFHLGLDFCCTWKGNDWVRPQLDVEMAFVRCLLPKHGGVLWITASFRGCNSDETILALTNDVFTWSQKCGYTMARVFCTKYRQIVSIMFVTC